MRHSRRLMAILAVSIVLSGCGASAQRAIIEGMNPGYIARTRDATDKAIAQVGPLVTEDLKNECRRSLTEASKGGLFASEPAVFEFMEVSRMQTCLMNVAAAGRWQGPGGPVVTYQVYPANAAATTTNSLATCTFELVGTQAKLISPNFGPSEADINGPCKHMHTPS